VRWPLLSALLLPLPFAALPLIVLLSSGGSEPAGSFEAGETRVVLTSVTVSATDLPEETRDTVATSEVSPCGSDHTSSLRLGT
jgi:hypothetical protein